jgi:hypothetical protein
VQESNQLQEASDEELVIWCRMACTPGIDPGGRRHLGNRLQTSQGQDDLLLLDQRGIWRAREMAAPTQQSRSAVERRFASLQPRGDALHF